MPIQIVGVDHQSAPLALRERLAISATALPAALGHLRATLRHGLILSTCNRTELITNVEYGADNVAAFLATLCAVPLDELTPHLRVSVGGEAVARLLRIVAGLDSLIVGEDQILAQFKTARDAAALAGTLDATLQRLGQAALTCGKRVRTETTIGQGNLSVVSIALREAAQRLGGFEERTILVVGAGDTGELALKHLTKSGRTRPARIVVTNRTAGRAELLATRYGVSAAPWAARDAALADADLVVSCTSSPTPVFGHIAVASALRERPTRPLLCYDLAVPRDLDPTVAELDLVTLRAVDDLAVSGAAARQGRLGAVADAEALIAVEAARFLVWRRERAVAPAVSALHDHAGAIRDGEVARALARLPDLSARDEAVVRDLAAAIVNKLLHRPVTTLKNADEGVALARVVEDLFGLDTPPPDRLPARSRRERSLALVD